MIAVGGTNGRFEIFSTATRVGGQATRGFSGGINAIAWHPSQQMLAIALATSRSIALVNSTTGVPDDIPTFITSACKAVAWSPDGNYLAAGGTNLILMQLHTSNKTLTLVRTVTMCTIVSLDWTADGRVTVSCSDGIVRQAM
jgi:WD40 repeat protein